MPNVPGRHAHLIEKLFIGVLVKLDQVVHLLFLLALGPLLAAAL